MNQSIFTLGLLLCFVLSCEKEIPVPPSTSAITIEKAGGDCVERGWEQEFYDFDLCGIGYTLHVTLEMFNFQQFHRIQSILRCYKRGGDPVADDDLDALLADLDADDGQDAAVEDDVDHIYVCGLGVEDVAVIIAE